MCVVHLSLRDPLYINVFRIHIYRYTFIILPIIQFAINIYMHVYGVYYTTCIYLGS